MDNDEPARFCRKVQHLRLRPVVQLNELLVPVTLGVAPDGRPSQGKVFRAVNRVVVPFRL